MHHELKILPVYFQAVRERRKLFEVRLNDRNFQEGDAITLREHNGVDYTGNRLSARIGYILSGYKAVADGHVVFSLIDIAEEA